LRYRSSPRFDLTGAAFLNQDRTALS